MRPAILVTAITALALLGAARSQAPLTKQRFATMRWLDGRWIGAGGGYAAFYEEYKVLDDSTIQQVEHPDSTWSKPGRVTTIEFRNGGAVQRRDGRATPLRLRINGDTARFDGTGGRGGYTWIRVGPDAWRALLDRPNATPIVYEMRRATR